MPRPTELTASREFCARVVDYLKKSQNLTLKEIGASIGQSESFVSLVHRRRRTFTISHLLALQKSMGISLPLLILETYAGAVPRENRGEYEELRRILANSPILRQGK